MSTQILHGLRLAVQNQPLWHLGADLFFYCRGSRDDLIEVIKAPLALETVVKHETLIDPTLRVDRDSLQQFMDELWTAGVRPSAAIAPPPNDGAVNAHLQDMRALVASSLGVALPQAQTEKWRGR